MKPIGFVCRAEMSITAREIADQILDTSRWPEFEGYGILPGIRAAEYIRRTEQVTGSQVRVTNRDGSSHVEEIVEWNPDRRLTLRMSEFSLPLSRLATHFLEIWELEPVESGSKTRVTRTFSMFPRSTFGRVLLVPISWLLRRAVMRHLNQINPDRKSLTT